MENREKIEACKKWLLEYLSRNTGLVDTVREEAKLKGFSKAVLKSARKELGVKTFHQFDEGGDTGNYFWYLRS